MEDLAHFFIDRVKYFYCEKRIDFAYDILMLVQVRVSDVGPTFHILILGQKFSCWCSDLFHIAFH